MKSEIKNIILTIAGIKAVKLKAAGEEIQLSTLLAVVGENVRTSAGDFKGIFEDITDADVGGRPVSVIRAELEADYRRAAIKIFKAQVKRRRRGK